MASEATSFSEELGHFVRADEWATQGQSSYVLAVRALEEGRDTDAVALARMTAQEALEAYELYAQWLTQLPELLSRAGLPNSELAKLGFDPVDARATLDAGWRDYLFLIDEFEEQARQSSTEGAAETLERARLTWLAAHDPALKQLAAMFTVGSGALGETVTGWLWDELLKDYYSRIADRYDPSANPWESSVIRLGLDAFEAVRGHLTGLERDGAFEVVEEPDRWVLRFAPCGSGGRTYPSIDDPGISPDGFTSGEHDWAWRTKGVCLYCAHCCQLQQRAPIEQIGIPLRVIQPPVRSDSGEPATAVCTWSIYKDPAHIPASAWTAVGAVPPAWAQDRDN